MMADVTVVVGGGNPQPRDCPHEWALLNDDPKYPEYRCVKCGHTQRRPKE